MSGFRLFPVIAATILGLSLCEGAAAKTADPVEKVYDCSSGDESILAYEDDIITIFKAPAGLMDCLGIEPGRFDSPFGDEVCLERCRPNTWAAARSGKEDILFYPNGAIQGVVRFQEIRGGTFLVSVGMVTHDRNYLFVSKTNTVHELANGDIDKEDIGESTYIVRGMKSYFKKPYGAFWISVVMDYDWNIVDVISEGENCIPKEEMMRRTWLDLSRVKRNSICY